MRIGIDLGGTNLAYGLVDDSGKLVDRGAVKITDKSPNVIARQMMAIYQSYIDKDYDIQSVGIGVPGPVLKDEGVIIQLVNLGWYNVPLVEQLKEVIQCPIAIGNDADAACVGESLFGAMKGHQNAVLLTLGTGVGSGIISNGKILTGFNGSGTELGHLLIDSVGDPCSCGNTGCLETYASASAIVRQYNRLCPESAVTEAKEVFDRYSEGEKAAKDAIYWFAKHLAIGIVNVYNVFAPEIIAIGGGVSKAFDVFYDILMDNVNERVFSKDITYGEIVPATLGNDAGIIGAAFLDKF